MTTNRQLKDQLFEQVSRLTKAVASPKRLELIELLAQAPKTVEMLADEAQISIALTSAHLKALKAANLVASDIEGKHRRYRLINAQVSELWVLLHQLATQHFPELSLRLDETLHNKSTIPDSATLTNLSTKQAIQLIDVRPENEYQQAHLPAALSMPIDQLPHRLNELDKDKPIVAYCRGPFCLYARDAVKLLIEQGFNASQWTDGVSEYQVREQTALRC
jgi:rhodanese-related sulfurtransferase